jgi:hypothetical protein
MQTSIAIERIFFILVSPFSYFFSAAYPAEKYLIGWPEGRCALPIKDDRRIWGDLRAGYNLQFPKAYR